MSTSSLQQPGAVLALPGGRLGTATFHPKAATSLTAWPLLAGGLVAFMQFQKKILSTIDYYVFRGSHFSPLSASKEKILGNFRKLHFRKL